MAMPHRARSIGLLLLCFALTLALWEWLYPINVFVVVLHEGSHGLASVLSGGKISQIFIDFHAGGWCLSSTNWPLITAAAGYVGSSFLGALILISAACTRRDRQVLAMLGILMSALALAYVSPRQNFSGFAFCLGFGVFLLVAARLLPTAACDFLLRLLGTASCLYSVVGVKNHLLGHWYGWASRPSGNAVLNSLKSDADVLADATGIPVMLWWAFFLAIGAVCFAVAACASVSNEAGWDGSAKCGSRSWD